jgi:para-nitrobenzyl esterase
MPTESCANLLTAGQANEGVSRVACTLRHITKPRMYSSTRAAGYVVNYAVRMDIIMKTTSRVVYVVACLALAAFAGGNGETAMAKKNNSRDGTPIVQTSDGAVKGQLSKGVNSFLGIPYGADTGGESRFLPPKPPTPWSDVREASQFGPQCAHQRPPMQGDITKVLFYSDLPLSEDCLTVNVWTPEATPTHKRPVMVYLHGGGFFMGSSSDRYYEGSNLSRENDVVVVTLNHRLSVFGYLALGPDAGPAYADSGAAGMLDIVQALRWVKANARQFGGDPDNVTIFGQSGGGIKVSILMAMPAATGLFQKAIMQSGPGRRILTPDQAAKITGDILHNLNLTAKDVAALQALPAEEILKAASGGMRVSPVMGNDAIPGQPFDASAPAQSSTIPLLIGGMKDELTSSLLSDAKWRTMDEASLTQRVTALVGEHDAAKLIALYRAAAPDDPPMYLWASIATDSSFFGESFPLADLKARQAAAVYMYRVDWRSPVLGGIIRSMHAVDLPFVWDNVDVAESLVGSGPQQDKMAREMSRSFAAFARTGDPNTAHVAPAWPRYTIPQRATMIFDTTPKVIDNPDRDKHAFWEAFKAQKASGT